MSDYPPPPPAPPPDGYGEPPPAGPVDALGRPLAEWWQRVVALLIDVVVLVIPTVAVAAIVAAALGELLGALAALAVAAAYYGTMNGGEKGQTLGKTALRIQVRDAGSHEPIGTQRGVIRYLVDGIAGLVPILGLFALIDGLWPLWDPRRQALHDKLVGSVVIKLAA